MRATLALAEVAERALAQGACSPCLRCCCRILGNVAECALSDLHKELSDFKQNEVELTPENHNPNVSHFSPTNDFKPPICPLQNPNLR